MSILFCVFVLWAATALLFMGLCSVVLLWAEQASHVNRPIIADDGIGVRALLGASVDYAIPKGELTPEAKKAANNLANNLNELALCEGAVASTFHHAPAKTSFKFAETRAQDSRALSRYDVAGEENCVLSLAGYEIATIRKAAESLIVRSQMARRVPAYADDAPSLSSPDEIGSVQARISSSRPKLQGDQIKIALSVEIEPYC